MCIYFSSLYRPRTTLEMNMSNKFVENWVDNHIHVKSFDTQETYLNEPLSKLEHKTMLGNSTEIRCKMPTVTLESRKNKQLQQTEKTFIKDSLNFNQCRPILETFLRGGI